MAVNRGVINVTSGTQGATPTATAIGVTTVSGSGSPNSVYYDTAAAWSGNFGVTCSVGTGAANGAFLVLNSPTQANLNFQVDVGLLFPATAPAAGFDFVRLRNSTGNFLTMTWSATDQKIYILDSLAQGFYTLALPTTNFTWGSKYRFRIEGVVGTTTSNGSFNAYLYNSSGTQVGTTGSKTTVNLGTTAFNNARAGVPSTSAGVAVGVGNFQVDDNTSNTPIGVYTPPANVLPTVDAGPGQTAIVGQSVTLSGTAVDADGTIASRQWTATTYPGSAPTITNSTSSSASFTPAAAGTYVFTFSATDNSGGTSTDTTQIVVSATALTLTANSSVGQAVVVATASGGVGPYTYSIDPVPADATQPSPGIFIWTQTQTATNYTVSVADSGGRTQSQSVTIAATTSGTLTEVVTLASGAWN